MVVYFLSVRGWQRDQQMDAPGGKRVAIKKTHKGIIKTSLVIPYVTRQKNPIKVC